MDEAFAVLGLELAPHGLLHALENKNRKTKQSTNQLCLVDDLLPSHISPYPKWEEGEWKALSEWCVKFNRKVIPMARSWKQGCIMKVD